jgi:hypothetical protein
MPAGALVGGWIASGVGSTPLGAGICPPQAASRSSAIKPMDVHIQTRKVEEI